jgi:putative sporulation protein YyaC
MRTLNPRKLWKALPPVKITAGDPEAAEKLVRTLSHLLNTHKEPRQTLVALCIGTDRSTGDSLGPIIGSALKRRLPRIPLLGTLEDPVHAVNLRDKLLEVERSFPDPFVLAVDACLGRLDSVGKIDVGPGPLQPGAGVNKSLPRVGDAYISGIVNVGGFLEYFVLQNTRLNVVMSLAEIITEGLHHIFLSLPAAGPEALASEAVCVPVPPPLPQHPGRRH